MLTAAGVARRRSIAFLRSITTSAIDLGYQQAKVVVLPSFLANDFQAFCSRNPAALPLLYRSQPGETSWLPLAGNVDIRTYISQYCVFENGRLRNTVPSLKGFKGLGACWPDMVCFYLGSSFGFEGQLREAGVPVRNVEQGKNGMYKTAVPCVPVGVFHCPLVVTMRPVPAGMVTTAAKISHLNPQAHGAPIHIGDPALLGIRDLSKPDYGYPVECHADDVPVFWACGVTAIEAICNSKPPLAFSHSPGSMFLTDIPDSPLPTSQLSPLCFLVSQDPLLYSMASQRAVGNIRQLEKVIGEDPGTRCICWFYPQVIAASRLFLWVRVRVRTLLRSCLALSHSTSVAITTGFPTHYMHSPPDETDGPPGALAMATMLLALSKQVTMVTDRRALQMNQDLVEEAVRTGVLKTTIPLVTFEDNGPDSALHFLCHEGDLRKPRFDHLVAIERTGRAADGNYYNMRGANIKHLVDPIDDLFIAATDIPGITTIGIGDGGNELGMGKIKEKVKTLMPNGSLVACDVAADYAITAGVSNWGGYAVACGLYLLFTCPSHQRYLRRGTEQATSPGLLDDLVACLPSEEAVLSSLVRLGVRSGKTGNLAMEVDGLTFHPTHSDLISRLLGLTLDSGPTGLP
ncbi:unnamed protein product [Lota lota]